MSADRKVVFDRAALDVLDAFAVEREEDPGEIPEHERLMVGRLEVMAFKLAMLAAMGRPEILGAEELRVTEADAQAALTVVRRWHGDARAFAAQMDENWFERHVKHCTRILKERKRVLRRDIARAIKVERRTLDSLESTLLDRELIRVDKITPVSSKPGPSTTIWLWTGDLSH